jgi:CRP/FNR family cyclic AMP-dependent transcriptional regulator
VDKEGNDMLGYHFLAESNFFKDLSSDTLRALATIADMKELKKRDILFHEGAPGRAIYLLKRGAIQLHKATPDGNEVVIKIVQPSEVFAEVVLFERESYPVTAVALSSSDVIVFPRAEVHQLLNALSFRNDFIAMLMRKQRYLAERIVQQQAHDVEGRLLWFLKEQFGSQKVVTLPFSKKDLAAAIGTTPETLSRLILKMKKRKILTWSGKTVTRHSA